MQQVSLPVSALSARNARAFLWAFCRSHAVPAQVVEDAVLIVSEVVGNAYLHARSGVRLCAQYSGQVLHVEVADNSPVLPQLREGSLEATGGRGVLILDALAARWGAREGLAGKVVWFELQ